MFFLAIKHLIIYFTNAIMLNVDFFQNNLTLPTLTPQTANFGFLENIFGNNKDLRNHILLIFKLYVNQSREKKLININNFIAEI